MGGGQSKEEDQDHEQKVDYGMSEKDYNDLLDDLKQVDPEPIFRRREGG